MTDCTRTAGDVDLCLVRRQTRHACPARLSLASATGRNIPSCLPQARAISPPLRYGNSLGAFESITRLQRLPALHTAGLYTDHVFVPILRREIAYLLRFLAPGVPDDDIVQVISHHGKHGLAALLDQHRRRRTAGRGVHPVRLARDLDLGATLRLLFLGVDFVNIAGAREARYDNRVDILIPR